MDPYGGEHRDEQGSFVFAVAVAVAEDVGGVVRLVTADAHLDDEVADLLLNKLGDGFRLVVEIGFVAGEFFGFGGNLGSGGKAVFCEGLIPLADALPGAFGGRGESWSRVVDCHAALEGELRRAQLDLIEVDGGRVFHFPTPALVFEVARGGR